MPRASGSELPERADVLPEAPHPGPAALALEASGPGPGLWAPGPVLSLCSKLLMPWFLGACGKGHQLGRGHPLSCSLPAA